MEPLHPDLREALKRAHPGLADREIDRFEELSARRFALDPEAQPEQLAELDADLARLVEERMPHYRDVAAAVRRVQPRPERPAPRVTFKGQH